jgi:hypothetical protein
LVARSAAAAVGEAPVEDVDLEALEAFAALGRDDGVDSDD